MLQKLAGGKKEAPLVHGESAHLGEAGQPGDGLGAMDSLLPEGLSPYHPHDHAVDLQRNRGADSLGCELASSGIRKMQRPGPA